jgi:flagellar biosynthetic protein FliR
MSVTLPAAGVIALLLASIRVAAWLIICPPFASRSMPAPVKALLSVGFALPVAPKLAARLPELSTAGLLSSAVLQVAIGALLGFVTALFFAAIQAAGDLIDVFGGVSVAFAFDPFSTSQSSVFGRFYHLLAVTLLFATDSYQLILRGFMSSFHAVPLDAGVSLSGLSRMLTTGVTGMFLAAVQIAGPLIAVLFCADVALGLLNRVAPALNAFSLGFPAKILLTLLLSGTAIATLPPAVHAVVQHGVSGMLGVVHR